jgi:photosystem II stability/assembly factor-like uncharacterized protein
MKKNIVVALMTLALLALTPIPVSTQTGPGSQFKSLVFTPVTVIDAAGASAKPDMTVTVSGNRIVALGKTGKVRIPTGAQN